MEKDGVDIKIDSCDLSGGSCPSDIAEKLNEYSKSWNIKGVHVDVNEKTKTIYIRPLGFKGE